MAGAVTEIGGRTFKRVPSDPDERLPWVLGAAAGVMVALFFFLPHLVFPIESLFITGLFALFTLVAAGRLAKVRDGRFLAALAHPGMLALGFFGLWAILQWQNLRVPSVEGGGLTVKITAHGRPIVLGYEMMVIAAFMGAALSLVDPPKRAFAWPTFRFILILSALIFTAHGFYQFLWSFEQAAEEFTKRFENRIYMTPLMEQSLDHLLNEKRIGGFLGGANLFAAWLSVLAGVSLSGLSRPSPGWVRVLSAIAYACACGAMYLTGSRGGALTLAFVTVCGVVLLWQESRDDRGAPNAVKPTPAPPKQSQHQTSTALLAAMLAPAFLLAARAASAATLWSRLGNSATIRERFYYWQIALRIWSMDWLSGAAPGGYMLFYAQNKPPTARESRYAHSWIFHIGAELGIVGLVLFSIFAGAVLWVGWSMWRRRREFAESNDRAQGREAVWLAMIFAALLFNGLFEHTLQLREFLALLGLLGGGVIGYGARMLWRPATTPEGGKRMPVARAGVALIAIAACASVAAYSLPRHQIGTFWAGEGKLMAEYSDHKRAAEFYGRAIEWSPDRDDFVAGRAMALFEIYGEYPNAVELLDRAVQMNPMSAALRANQALLLHEANRRDEALAKIDEAVALYPNDAGYRLERAKARLSLKEPALANEDLQFILDNKLPLWEYQQPVFQQLKQRVAVSLENPPTESNPAYDWGATAPVGQSESAESANAEDALSENSSTANP